MLMECQAHVSVFFFHIRVNTTGFGQCRDETCHRVSSTRVVISQMNGRWLLMMLLITLSSAQGQQKTWSVAEQKALLEYSRLKTAIQDNELGKWTQNDGIQKLAPTTWLHFALELLILRRLAE